MWQGRIARGAAVAAAAIVVALVATPAPHPISAGATTASADSSATDQPAADRPALIAAARQLMAAAGVQPEDLLAADGESSVQPTTGGRQRSRNARPSATQTSSTRLSTRTSPAGPSATPPSGPTVETAPAGAPAVESELITTFRQLLTQLGLRPEDLLEQPSCRVPETGSATAAEAPDPSRCRPRPSPTAPRR